MQTVGKASIRDENRQSNFLKGTVPDEIRLISDSLTLCDVRCGPTEDKMVVQLGCGVYAVAVENYDESVAVMICRSGAKYLAHGAELGEVSIDGGVLGAYDSALFTEIFGADAEDFYDWGESLFEVAEDVRVFSDSIEPYEFAYIPTCLDGVFLITELIQDDCRVGVRLSTSFSESQVAEKDRMFKFFFASASTSVEVWLDPVYDDEDILDCIVDSLGEVLGRDVEVAAVEKFISEIESIELAMQTDEELSPRRSLDLLSFPTTWKSDRISFCKYLREVMLESRAG
jgi:hypothetical protein